MKRFSFPALIPLTLILATVTSLLGSPVRAPTDDTTIKQAAAGRLTSTPLSISAKIDKIHAQAYAIKVFILTRTEASQREVYNTYVEELARFANEMTPLIGSNDPYDKVQLEAIKETLAVFADLYRTEYLKYCTKYAKDAQGFYPACKNWFSKPGDKARFLKATSQLSRGIGLANEAFAYQAFAYKVLSKEDIKRARSYNNEATRLVKKAEPLIDEALKELRALKR